VAAVAAGSLVVVRVIIVSFHGGHSAIEIAAHSMVDLPGTGM
jgi:hypothetical protein